jgi:hypothetical protein
MGKRLELAKLAHRRVLAELNRRLSLNDCGGRTFVRVAPLLKRLCRLDRGIGRLEVQGEVRT